jgi:hypothetical protein
MCVCQAGWIPQRRSLLSGIARGHRAERWSHLGLIRSQTADLGVNIKVLI